MEVRKIFTGLIEEIGIISGIKKLSQGVQISIICDKILDGTSIGDSIATEGVCLTVVGKYKDSFVADCMFETLDRSSLKFSKIGDRANLERALALGSRLGGHLVTGDVECLGTILDIQDVGIAKLYTFEIPSEYFRYVIEKGRVTIDGASLTVFNCQNNRFSISLIPHTQKKITLGKKRVGDRVNIETDIIGKYIEKFIFVENSGVKNREENHEKKSELTLEFLAENGF